MSKLRPLCTRILKKYLTASFTYPVASLSRILSRRGFFFRYKSIFRKKTPLLRTKKSRQNGLFRILTNNHHWYFYNRCQNTAGRVKLSFVGPQVFIGGVKTGLKIEFRKMA